MYSIIFNNDRALLCREILLELAPASSVGLARSSGAKSFSYLQLLSVVAMGNVTTAGHSPAISQTTNTISTSCYEKEVRVKLAYAKCPEWL